MLHRTWLKVWSLNGQGGRRPGSGVVQRDRRAAPSTCWLLQGSTTRPSSKAPSTPDRPDTWLFARRESGLKRADHGQLDDANALQAHGIIGGRSLFEHMASGVPRVRAAWGLAEQFEVYRDPTCSTKPTRCTTSFATSTSAWAAQDGAERYPRRHFQRAPALRKVFWRRPWEAWMRLNGNVITSFWMTILCMVVVAPFG